MKKERKTWKLKWGDKGKIEIRMKGKERKGKRRKEMKGKRKKNEGRY